MARQIKDSDTGLVLKLADFCFARHIKIAEAEALVEDSPNLSFVGEEKVAPAEVVRDEEPIVEEKEPEVEKPSGFFFGMKKDTQKGVN